MKVLFTADECDYDTNIERAKAIIDAVMRPDIRRCDDYLFKENLRDLEEIKDYIDVYIKHKKGENGV